MPHEFEVSEEIPLDATPEQVWEAIATGPGMDSWFLGRNEIEPRAGGRASMTMGDFTTHSTVTTWDPPHRLATRSDTNPDGTFMAFEYLVEGRGGGSTVLRFVHSGMLGDDWEAEYDALRKGDGMYLRQLAMYLKHFPGGTATHSMLLPGSPISDAPRVWSAVARALGVTGTPAEGDKVRIAVDGLTPTEGVVEYVYPSAYILVRTAEGIYAFMHGFMDTPVVELHAFDPGIDTKATETAWQNWLAGL